jgi:predicted RNA-binding protein with PUA-like domain
VAYWLIKSEPGVFSIADLKKAKRTEWDGVRNYLARNNMRAMKKGDRCLYYHSNANPSAVAGVAEVVREAYPEPKDERWSLVDVKFVSAFTDPVSLETIKNDASLKKMVLVNNSRLSVQPVTAAEYKRVLALAARGRSPLAPSPKHYAAKGTKKPS